MLPLGLGACLVDPNRYFASDNLAPVMFILSFPAGPLVFLAGALAIGGPPLSPPLDYSLMWIVAFVVGYLQWFWAFPRLFGKTEVITLGLTAVAAAPILADQPPLCSSAEAKQQRRIAPGRLLHFDNRGRTPLERVIHRGSRRT